MGYNKEYNADQVLEILKMDDPVSEFEKSMDNMSAFLSYASAENAHIIADKIREEHEKDWKIYIKLDIENPIIRINTAFKGCSSLEKISVLPRIYHN